MFVDKGSTLIGMASDAGLLGIELLIHHARLLRHFPGGLEGAMRVVAVRALNHALVHAVLGWHGELRALRGVAGVAELALFFCQQKLRRGRMVNGMAAGAGDIVERVLRTPDIGAR